MHALSNAQNTPPNWHPKVNKIKKKSRLLKFKFVSDSNEIVFYLILRYLPDVTHTHTHTRVSRRYPLN